MTESHEYGSPRNCWNCAYYEGTDFIGKCRRRAPVVTKSRWAPKWPEVNGQKDWCGEHSGTEARINVPWTT